MPLVIFAVIVSIMTHIEVWITAFALAMDCFVMSIASGIILKRIVWRPMFTMAVAFGFFQAFNPLLGWLCADNFRAEIECVDHWIAFGILLFLGGRMILESFKPEEERSFDPRRLKVILTLAVATSIDALAMGISFSCMGYSSFDVLLYPLLAIGVVSFGMSMLGLAVGIKFGKGIGKKLRAEMWGGMMLVCIGVKVLIEHL